MNTRSATAAVEPAAQQQQRPATAGRASSAHPQRNTVDFGRPQTQQVHEVQQQQQPQSMSSTVPVDHRATGSAVEHPVIFDGRRATEILSGLEEYEKQLNALRHRFRGVIRDVQDFNFENSKFCMSDNGSIYTNGL